MAFFELAEILTTLKDLASKALRIKGEVSLTNSSIPDNEAIPTKTIGGTIQEANILTVTTAGQRVQLPNIHAMK